MINDSDKLNILLSVHRIESDSDGTVNIFCPSV